MTKRSVQTILSPTLFSQVTDLDQKLVVVIDVLRATTTIATILNNGAKAVIPVLAIEDAMAYKSKGYLTGGERNGEKIQEFDFGNSPFDYSATIVSNQEVVLTTTNGTKCLNMAQSAAQVITAAFVNLVAVNQYIQSTEMDVVIFAAGWRDKVNLEDSLLAGAICQLMGSQAAMDDASLMCLHAYNATQHDIYEAFSKANHFLRLKQKNIHKDLVYCCEKSMIHLVPVLKEGKLIAVKMPG
jgi:2-phosphosulfolactate phosphatase